MARLLEKFEVCVYSRIDMLIKEGVPYVLEANNLPGMIKTAILSAAAAGITFAELLDKIIELSLKERRF